MKKIILLISLFCFVQTIRAQDEKPSQRVKAGFGLSVVQVQPEFPGGADSLQSFLKTNLVYPPKAKTDHTSGRVYLSFRVSEAGKIIEPKVISSVSPELDAEALRVVNLMPEWKPGTASGHPVKVQYILPIDFVMAKNPGASN